MSFNFMNSDKLIEAFVIAGLGTLASLWANCVFVINLQNGTNKYNYNIKYYDLIFHTVQYEYVVICIISVVTLIWGLTKSYKQYLLPWACLKLCENMAIFFGTTMILFNYYDSFTGLIPLGISAIAINIYASICVYKAYRRMLLILPFKKPTNINYEQMETIVEEEEEEEETVGINKKVQIKELNPATLTKESSVYIIPDEKCEKI